MGKQLRLDKFLSDNGVGTRSSIKQEIRKGLVRINGGVAKKPEEKIDPETDRIEYRGTEVAYRRFVYYMLNKPAGVVSATEDRREKTVMELLPEGTGKDLFPVGRLDKDTEGLLVLCNDGELAHRLLSPKRHVPKVYYARVRGQMNEEDVQRMKDGIRISEDFKAMPARLELLGALDEEICEIRLTIHEGKFHQVKKMVRACGKEVIYLKRLQMGGLCLDETLKPGEVRKLTKEELDMLKEMPAEETRNFSEAGETGRVHEMLKGKEALLFDMDGTLIDSMWMWGKIDHEYLARFGLEVPDDLAASIEGISIYQVADVFKKRFGIEDSHEKMMQDWVEMAWEKYEKEVPLKEGILPLLKYCRENKIRLGIATSNSDKLAELILKTHGISDYFQAVKTSSEVPNGKPDPAIYRLTAEALGVSPKKCLVFEDAISGILSGKRAGMQVCAVYDEATVKDDPEKRELSDYYIHSFLELLS